jgi:hypothetical protein
VVSRALEQEIDRLYQLPVADFTSARNALAKTAGADAAEVRSLAKPPLAAWAVNQVYWRDRAVYQALTDAATELRRIHKSILAGKHADLRAASKAHDAQVASALESAVKILASEGQHVTEQTRQAIMTTLRALPADEPPGRLSRTLQPGGFEMLAGLPITGRAGGEGRPAKSGLAQSGAAKTGAAKSAGVHAPVKSARELAAEKRAHEEHAQAVRLLREAEQAARREEFEKARAAREADKAAAAVDRARAAVEAAHEALADAEKTAASAKRALDAAEKRAATAEEKWQAARSRAEP